jgi:mannose-6-phosphate isomerase-like protein (cupin superfamily)
MNVNVRSSAAMPRGARGSWPAMYAGDSTAGFDVGDDRVGVPLDPKPVFLNTRQLSRDLLRPVKAMNGGQGTVLYRRAMGPAVFTSNWAFVDHLLLPPGASVGRHMHAGVDEFYYVLSGGGRTSVNEESAAIAKGDAVPVLAKDVHSFENTGSEPLELLVVGIALEKGKLDVTDVP